MTQADRLKTLQECEALITRALTLADQAGFDLVGAWLAQALAAIDEEPDARDGNQGRN